MKERLKVLSAESKTGEFVRFCIVGAIATLIDAGVFYLVIMKASYYVALVSGYFISLIVNYFLTVIWTFKKKPNAGNAIGVLIAHMINLFVVRMGTMYVLVDLLLMNDKVAYIPTVVLSVVTNFVIVRFFVCGVKGLKGLLG